MIRALSILIAFSAFAAHAQISTKIYAQELVDRVVAANRGLAVVAIEAAPAKGKDRVIIASNVGLIGEPLQSIGHASTRHRVMVPLQDATGDNIGALVLEWPGEAGADTAKGDQTALQIRDAMSRRILNAANLVDAFPFEPLAITATGAQKLVDAMQAEHAELKVLALRAPARKDPGLVVLGSTFGRHGKKADADDMKVLDAIEPIPGVYAGGKRFGVDMPLHDATGQKIGTMNVGYAFHEGDDRSALLARAVALRAEIEKRIANARALADLDP